MPRLRSEYLKQINEYTLWLLLRNIEDTRDSGREISFDCWR